ncbi:MAG: DegV family EDD domain-containing protein, partial [Clostridia bacterium]|nr:DegV family EDD domain-containing protein [Clostridia bacterium]
MSKIKIMCTSTGCIEYAPERYRNLGIEIIRIHVFFEGKEYKEGLDLDPVEFYQRLEALENPKDNLPYTAMPDTEDIRAAFQKAIAEGYDEAMVFVISTGCGGTYGKICLIAKEYEDKLKIHVIDTKITCFGEGFLAIQAAEFAAQGMSSEDILKETAWMMRRQVFMGVDGKLDYLIYNGRLKGGKA